MKKTGNRAKLSAQRARALRPARPNKILSADAGKCHDKLKLAGSQKANIIILTSSTSGEHAETAPFYTSFLMA